MLCRVLGGHPPPPRARAHGRGRKREKKTHGINIKIRNEWLKAFLELNGALEQPPTWKRGYRVLQGIAKARYTFTEFRENQIQYVIDSLKLCIDRMLLKPTN